MIQTMADALQHIEGLRTANLGKNGWKAWSYDLEEWHPQEVAKAASAVAERWKQSSPWPLGELKTELRKRYPRETAGWNGHAQPMFWFDPFGRCGGDPSVLQKCPAEERANLAEYVLQFVAPGDSPSAEQTELAKVLAGGER